MVWFRFSWSVEIFCLVNGMVQIFLLEIMLSLSIGKQCALDETFTTDALKILTVFYFQGLQSAAQFQV